MALQSLADFGPQLRRFGRCVPSELYLDFNIAENFIAETVEQAKVFQAILNSPAEDAAGPDEETISEMPTIP